MPTKRYDLFYTCRQCGRAHPMGVAFDLAGGPAERINLSAWRATRRLPSHIAKLVGRPVLCPQSGEHILTDDPTRIYIQPLTKSDERE